MNFDVKYFPPREGESNLGGGYISSGRTKDFL